MIDGIVTALKADATLNAIHAGRVYPYDVRRFGWEAEPGAFGPYGTIQPLIMVDDAGFSRAPFSHTAARRLLVYVWCWASRTTAGRVAVRLMAERVDVLLHGWQDSETGSQVFPTFRLGEQSDDEAVFDRVDVQAGAIAPVARF